MSLWMWIVGLVAGPAVSVPFISKFLERRAERRTSLAVLRSAARRLEILSRPVDGADRDSEVLAEDLAAARSEIANGIASIRGTLPRGDHGVRLERLLQLYERLWASPTSLLNESSVEALAQHAKWEDVATAPSSLAEPVVAISAVAQDPQRSSRSIRTSDLLGEAPRPLEAAPVFKALTDESLTSDSTINVLTYDEARALAENSLSSLDRIRWAVITALIAWGLACTVFIMAEHLPDWSWIQPAAWVVLGATTTVLTAFGLFGEPRKNRVVARLMKEGPAALDRYVKYDTDGNVKPPRFAYFAPTGITVTLADVHRTAVTEERRARQVSTLLSWFVAACLIASALLLPLGAEPWMPLRLAGGAAILSFVAYGVADSHRETQGKVQKLTADDALTLAYRTKVSSLEGE